jgi:hypothetical protein
MYHGNNERALFNPFALNYQRQAGLVAEGQILCDTINVDRPEEPGFSQRPAAFGTFALKQMASAGASEQHFTGARYLETFGH